MKCLHQAKFSVKLSKDGPFIDLSVLLGVWKLYPYNIK